MFLSPLLVESLAADGSKFDDDIMIYLITNKTYNKEVRPGAQVNVAFQLSYRQMVSLDEKTQTLTSNVYLYSTWLDSRLTWDPNNYEDLDQIVIPITKIWVPDFAVINTASNDLFIEINNSNLATVTSDGQVNLTLSISSLKTKCKVNILKYPFDSQNCPIIIGSWQLDSTRIDFSTDDRKVSTDDYIQSAVWELKGITVKTQNTSSRFQGRNLVNEDAVFTVMLKRRSLYFVALFIPLYILNLATLLAFFVSNAIVVQVNLCMTVFLTFGVYSLKISGDMPTQSDYFPLANIYFICAYFYTLISLIWFICANYYTTRNRLPRWMAFVAKYVKLALFCFFPRVPKPQPKPKDVEDNASEKIEAVESINNYTTEYTNSNYLRNRTMIVYEKLPKPGCNKCEMCKNCESSKDKENEKKKAKELLDSNILALNYLAFIVVFVIILSVNIGIWVAASSS